MGTTESRSFETEHGFKVADGPYITGGAASPVGLDLPTNTIYVQTPTTGGSVFWRKHNTGISDWIKVVPMDFYQSVVDLTETATTSPTPQNKILITTPSNLPAGDYRVGFSFGTKQEGQSTGGNWRVRLDDTTNLYSVSIGDAVLLDRSGFTKVTLASGIHTIAIQYSRTSGTTYISNAHLEFWRLP